MFRGRPRNIKMKSNKIIMTDRVVNAIVVPVLYLQSITLPPVNLEGILTIGANFRLVPKSWNNRHAKIDSDGTQSPTQSQSQNVWIRHRVSIKTLLTIDNASPADEVIFAADTFVDDIEEVMQVLLGIKKVSRMDAIASWFNELTIVRNRPKLTTELGCRSIRLRLIPTLT